MIPAPGAYRPQDFAAIDEHLQDSLEAHARAEAALVDALTYHRDTTKNASKADINERFEAVRESTRHLVRLMHHMRYPAYAPAHVSGAGDGFTSFVNCFEKMIELSEESLMSTAEEAKSQDEELRNTVARYRQAGGDLKALQSDLEQEKTSGETVIQEKDAEITRLSSEIEKVKLHSSQNYQTIVEIATQKQQSAEEKFSSAEHSISERLAILQKELAKMRDEHKEEETTMRKKNFKLYQEVEAWIEKYDVEMEKLTQQMDELNAQMQADAPRLEFLEEELAKFDAARAEREEIARKKAEEEEARRLEQQRRDDAATTIQAAWRGHIVRHPPKPKAKKDAKKKAKK